MPTPLSRCIHHSGNISAVGRWCFRSLRAPRLVRWRKVNFYYPRLLPPPRAARAFCPARRNAVPHLFFQLLAHRSIHSVCRHSTHSRAKAGNGFPARSAYHYRSAGSLGDVVSLPVAQQFPRFCDCRALRSCSLAKSPRAGAPLYRRFLPGWRS